MMENIMSERFVNAGFTASTNEISKSKVAVSLKGIQKPQITLTQPMPLFASTSDTVSDSSTDRANVLDINNIHEIHKPAAAERIRDMNSSKTTEYMYENKVSRPVVREINNKRNMSDEATNYNGKQIATGQCKSTSSLSEHTNMSRQFSGSSLCSWSSFDTALTDDNLSDEENNKSTGPTNIAAGRKGNLWGMVKKAIHWSPFVQNYKKKYPWIQLAGHDGAFKAGEKGTILKKATQNEIECLIKLMKDVLRPYVPEYRGEIEENCTSFIEMQDLLADFDAPSVMDCKMGTRTYLEAELMMCGKQPKLRTDLYDKMIKIDPNEPTDQEKSQKAITKPRYMQWRENLSSTATLGFRIEGIKNSDQKPCKDFKTTRTNEDVGKVFFKFISEREDIRLGYLQRLKVIRATLETSPFFAKHEVIGSSLLFVHDTTGNTGVWLIDFGKTTQMPDDRTLNHRDSWQEGNREDGYLYGLDNMINIWEGLTI